MPISATADFPTGTLGYHDDIIAGAEYEWTVDKLEFTGDFASYSTEMYIGSEILQQGDKIKIVVTEDPDTATGIWFEVYVNGILVDPDFGYLIYYGMMYGTYGGFFISPVTYTNATGTYNIYEQIIEEIETGYNEYSDFSTEYGGYTYEYGYTFKIEAGLDGDVLTVLFHQLGYLSLHGGTYDLSYIEEMKIQTSLNIRTGLVGSLEFLYNVDTPYETGKFHLIIDSDYASGGRTVPFNWAFSLLGISSLAIVAVFIKRKRN